MRLTKNEDFVRILTGMLSSFKKGQTKRYKLERLGITIHVPGDTIVMPSFNLKHPHVRVWPLKQNIIEFLVEDVCHGDHMRIYLHKGHIRQLSEWSFYCSFPGTNVTMHLGFK